ncbi:hypothetical protein G4V62_13475 [Bacillaceae bacterium SIJ1]|uniref:PepSY domain-containing protein n=1 Tax=Litoribacterium kuwaitense TaxID=1398745 RepID=UPI0013EC1FDC|nr:PepSY domain-containing protein [Litoribacterium kuwaitense]NGP45907.1 hypothetical protein [Litoribacterium kuwaitense]
MKKRWFWVPIAIVVVVGGFGIQQLLAIQQTAPLSERDVIEKVTDFYNGEVTETDLINDTYVLVLTNDQGTYQIQVDATEGSIQRIKQLAQKEAPQSLLSEEEVSEKALEAAGGGEVVSIEETMLDDIKAFAVIIEQEKKRYHFKMDRKDGAILEQEEETLEDRETPKEPTDKNEANNQNDQDDTKQPKPTKNNNTVKNNDTSTQPAQPQASTVVSSAEAMNIALQAAGGGTVKEMEVDDDDDTGKVYEIEVILNDQEIDVVVQAQSGEVISISWDD